MLAANSHIYDGDDMKASLIILLSTLLTGCMAGNAYDDAQYAFWSDPTN